MSDDLDASLQGSCQHQIFEASHTFYCDLQRIYISPRVLRVTLDGGCCEGILTFEEDLDEKGPFPPSPPREQAAMNI